MDSPKSPLARAFRAARYRVELPTGVVDVRLGVACAPLARFLRERGVPALVGVTAHNPGGRLAPPARNAAGQRRLAARLRREGRSWLEALHQDPRGRWPDEPANWVLGGTLEEGRTWGAAFGQAAFVYAPVRGVPRLVWIKSGRPCPPELNSAR